MNFKLIIIIIFFLALLSDNYLYPQDGINKVLKGIESNNKLIKSATDYVNAKKMEFRTGLTPYDPEISFDYLFGTPKELGNQSEFMINFTFDFPTIYGKKSFLSDLKSENIIYESTILKQKILLEAKLICIELIYLDKREVELKTRLNDAEQLYEFFKIKLEKGEGNMIDVNKAKLQMMNALSDFELNESERIKSLNKLIGLNGGIPVIFVDAEYPNQFQLPVLAEIEKRMETTDPELISLDYRLKISKQEVEINKDLRLPKLSFGYRYENLLSEKFNGFHVGITLPLWENNNTVKAKELESVYALSQIDAYKTQLKFETKELFEKNEILRKILIQNKEDLSTLNNIELLKKSLLFGEISSIDYLMELTYYYSIKDKIDLLEKEFYEVQAKLYKFEL
ncbi:MAG TPA: TolC family protein [Ignavibacteria bacterium]|nr:TolC family protein [Ignavibacteria bacterium]